jgi:hypothetical protein
MAFLAARYLSDMLDEAIRDLITRTTCAEEGSEGIPTVSSRFDTDPSPGMDAAIPGYQQPFDSLGVFPPWSADDMISSFQPGDTLNECDVSDLELPLNIDSAALWDFSPQY